MKGSDDAGGTWGYSWDTDDWGFQTLAELPGKAVNPSPAHQATEVDFSSRTLSWDDGAGDLADTFNVYIGDAADNLTLVSSAQSGETYVLTDSNMELWPKGMCYWRIDSTNGAGTTTGDDWYFTVGPLFMRYNKLGVDYGIQAVELINQPVRVAKGNTIYGVPLVDTDDADASHIRVFDGTNIKAFVKREL
ncbi:hypothetical protein LCGC14_1275610 [marine sediment metagenome]|uniref:Fibronectin type-III domain-containing protein n=1 Tax=marine sediment metagenome TaxID=412755 RepID=A0A0F9KYK3_9ZZZZ